MSHMETTLIILVSVCYYSTITQSYNLFNESVICYQAQPLMLYNVRTTYKTFGSKNWTPKGDVIAFHNSK